MSLTLHDLLTPVNMKGITYSTCTLCVLVYTPGTIVIIIPTYTFAPRFQPGTKSYPKKVVCGKNPRIYPFWGNYQELWGDPNNCRSNSARTT